MSTRWKGMDPLAGMSDDSEEDVEEGITGDASAADSQEYISLGAKGMVSSLPAASLRKQTIGYEALSRHGFRGGPSVLYVPPPKQDAEHNYDWSTGKRDTPEVEEKNDTFEEREKLRQLTNDGVTKAAEMAVAQRDSMKRQREAAIEEGKALSFAQKEKRKRDVGQASRAKNYVEEEKRQLRESGVYSNFDS